MSISEPCPETAKLNELLSSDIDPGRLEHLIAHVDECHACMHYLSWVNESEVLTGPLAVASALANSGDFEAVDRLKEAPLGDCQQKFGHFRIVRKLGEGGMGQVYECIDERLGRNVAVKWIKPAVLSKKLLERLEAEARIHARLSHPNIVSLLDFGIADGFPYLVMELIRGENLRAIVGKETLNHRESAMLMADVARAVHAAHGEGIVHLDLKPANILLQPRRVASAGIAGPAGQKPSWLPKITDFGLARSVDTLLDENSTMLVRGTPFYMAPEQLEGRADIIGPAADIYALGVIIYESLTGRVPFSGRDFSEVSQLIRYRQPVAPRDIQASVPLDIQTICLKCLEKDPRHRYASAEELADDLARFARNLPIKARPVGWLGRLRRWARRNPIATILACVTAFSVAALTVGSVVFAITQQQLRQEAERLGRQARANEEIANERFATMRDNLFRELETASQNFEQLRGIVQGGTHPDRVAEFHRSIVAQRFERARELVRRPEMLGIESERMVEAFYLAALDRQNGDQDGAMKLFQEVVDRAQALAVKGRSNVFVRFMALNSDNYMGVIRSQRADTAGAIAYFQHGWDHYRVRPEEAPVDARLKRFSMMIGLNLAEVLETSNRRAEAQAIQAECAGIERLAVQDDGK